MVDNEKEQEFTLITKDNKEKVIKIKPTKIEDKKKDNL